MVCRMIGCRLHQLPKSRAVLLLDACWESKNNHQAVGTARASTDRLVLVLGGL